MEAIDTYLTAVSRQFSTGIARELAYRGCLESLIESLASELVATSDPARIQCGAPDYIVTRRNIPIGYVEAKDIGKDLDASEFAEQFQRYRSSLGNLIITDYLTFKLYRDGELVSQVSIATVHESRIVPSSDCFPAFLDLLREFTSYSSQTITSPAKLSRMMADKARLLARIIATALESDEESEDDTTLREQMQAFREILIHDIDSRAFADIYAQTIAYGMFAARLHDSTLDSFTRQEAAELIPKSNPFLRNLFGYIAGANLDDRIRWIVDALAELFRATDVSKLLDKFGRSTQKHDPIIHFYETFLAEYDPALRKSRGVWYTPEPVVHFIVRAVDEVLRTKFRLPSGIADTSRITVERDSQTKDRRSKTGYKRMEVETHRVQILDPAVGTGTFLADVTKTIHSQFKARQGAWPSYVKEHLIPRLNGFEVLMASYAMAHLKMDLLLRETGDDERDSQRFRIFLTNSLEEYHPDTGTLFASWLSREASEANFVKKETPVMVVLGNPPYSGVSSNMGDWISDLIEEYKYVDGEHFGERKHWLHDDYVKFIRYGQHIVERNGEGVIAYINNHSFVDNPTFRGMRWNLLQSFDEILIIDLNGSTKKEASKPSNVIKDENVFDIQQGVSINVFIKTGTKRRNQAATVKYFSVWGDRESKYAWLWDNSIDGLDWAVVEPAPPYFFFSPTEASAEAKYMEGFSIEEVFTQYTMGYASAKDSLTVAFSADELWRTVTDFKELSVEELRSKYGLKKDSRDWKVSTAKNDIVNNYDSNFISATSYRPFDDRFTYFTGNSRGFFASPQKKVMSHLGRDDNLAFCSCRMNRDFSNTYWLAKNIVSKSVISSLDNAYVFPLYLYPEATEEDVERIPNLNTSFLKKFEDAIDLQFVPELQNDQNTFCPYDVLDYIYAVLHHPEYLSANRDLLKRDFPHVPYPNDASEFRSWVNLGRELRTIHTSESFPVSDSADYPISGSNVVDAISHDADRISINNEQYFGNVAEDIWNMKIGGYAPAQKWLKDRKNRQLTYDDVLHYQSIISRLEATRDEVEKIRSLVLPGE